MTARKVQITNPNPVYNQEIQAKWNTTLPIKNYTGQQWGLQQYHDVLNKKCTFLVPRLFKIYEMYDDEDMAFSVQTGYLGSLEKKDKSKVQ